MRQAIETTYFGPTNYKGARIRARAQAGTIFVPWDYEYGVELNHVRAAKAFRDKFGWEGVWVGGANANDAGFTFVDISEALQIDALVGPVRAIDNPVITREGFR